MPDTSEHVLVVYDDDGERSYFLEHSEGCPYETDDDFVVGGKDYTCDAANIWSAGAEYAVPDIEELQPGRYSVQAYFEHTPSLPTNGGEEWDAWLEVVR